MDWRGLVEAAKLLKTGGESGIRIRHKTYIQRHTTHGLHSKYMKVRDEAR